MTETPAARSDEDITIDDGYTDQAVHFSTAINAAWQKLEYYYNKTDITPIHRAAVLLHPRMKWRWFERYWRTKPEWIADARLSIAELWSEYKDQPVTASSPTVADCNGPQDEWSSGTDEVDQLQMYEQEAHTDRGSHKQATSQVVKANRVHLFALFALPNSQTNKAMLVKACKA
jgi:hypothetical protein